MSDRTRIPAPSTTSGTTARKDPSPNRQKLKAFRQEFSLSIIGATANLRSGFKFRCSGILTPFSSMRRKSYPGSVARFPGAIAKARVRGERLELHKRASRKERTMRRGLFLSIAAAMLLASGVCYGQSASPYPTRQVRIVVPYPAGGPTDLIARLIAQKLGERLGQSFFVENVAGASGAVGAGQVAHAAPDRYSQIKNDIVVWGKVMKDANIPVN